MRFFLPVFALTAALASPALAQVSDDLVSFRVDIGDLDLSSPQGRAELETRVEAEARIACTRDIDARYTFGRDLIDQRCVAEARDAAMAEVERLTSAPLETQLNAAAG
ncbi:MAG: UrcA family protein [Pseudomonadota bacterium]